MFRLLVDELCHDISKVNNATLIVAYHFQVQLDLQQELEAEALRLQIQMRDRVIEDGTV